MVVVFQRTSLIFSHEAHSTGRVLNSMGDEVEASYSLMDEILTNFWISLALSLFTNMGTIMLSCFFCLIADYMACPTPLNLAMSRAENARGKRLFNEGKPLASVEHFKQSAQLLGMTPFPNYFRFSILFVYECMIQLIHFLPFAMKIDQFLCRQRSKREITQELATCYFYLFLQSFRIKTFNVYSIYHLLVAINNAERVPGTSPLLAEIYGSIALASLGFFKLQKVHDFLMEKAWNILLYHKALISSDPSAPGYEDRFSEENLQPSIGWLLLCGSYNLLCQGKVFEVDEQMKKCALIFQSQGNNAFWEESFVLSIYVQLLKNDILLAKRLFEHLNTCKLSSDPVACWARDCVELSIKLRLNEKIPEQRLKELERKRESVPNVAEAIIIHDSIVSAILISHGRFEEALEVADIVTHMILNSDLMFWGWMFNLIDLVFETYVKVWTIERDRNPNQAARVIRSCRELSTYLKKISKSCVISK